VSLASPESVHGERTGTPAGGLRWLGWLLLVVLLCLAAVVHRGIGPRGAGLNTPWYAPTRFFFESDLFAFLVDPPGLAFTSLGMPALLLTTGVLLAAHSAIAKAVAVSALGAVLLFVFYGVYAPSPWQFFGWRGSAALALIALCIGSSVTAPALAASWLRLSWPLRGAVYLPFAAAAMAFLCNATGTDPTLPFAVSPWPVVPVFGLETFALFVAVGWLGTAIGIAGLANAPGRGRAALALGAGVATPALLLLAGSQLTLLPFRLPSGLLVGVTIACAVATAATATLRLADRGPALTRRARRIAVGAALVALPVCAGQAWAFTGYQLTREARARDIIDALERHVERESLYPDTLEALVEAGDLEGIPLPAIGLGPGSREPFRYQSFGASYLLEFTATRWVQCAYTPAPIYEEDEEAEALEDERLGESWSCPSRPPELW